MKRIDIESKAESAEKQFAAVRRIVISSTGAVLFTSHTVVHLQDDAHTY